MPATAVVPEIPTRISQTTMKALVYHGPGRRTWETKPRPRLINPTDALVAVTTATICGTDLHILKGDVPTVEDGRTLGHEAVGRIEEVGNAVRGFKKGDKVLVSCISSCGRCDFCRKGMYSHCRDGGLDPRPPHRRDASRIRPRPPRGHEPLRPARRGR